MDVILKSNRDPRTMAWLIEQVGEAAVEGACSKLDGRLPYVSNIAKVLELKPPEFLQRPTRDEVAVHLAEIRALLAKPPNP